MSEVVFDVTPAEVVVDAIVAEVVVTTGPAGPKGDTGATGVVAATSPITYNSGTQTVAFDQSANNITNDGRYARLAAANAFTVGGHTITNAAAGTTPLLIKGYASQTAPSFAIQTSLGTNLLRITDSAFMTLGAGLGFLGQFSVQAQAASTIGAVIRGAASQSANLQEWQNSAGTVLARIEPGGTIRSEAGAIALTGNFAAMQTSQNGGTLLMKKGTAAASNPGTDYVRMYFRDGTNAGTLKLVVRAGAAGAETTILDNIPQ